MQINKLWYIHIIGYYSTIKNKLLTYAITWDFKIIIPLKRQEISNKYKLQKADQ